MPRGTPTFGKFDARRRGKYLSLLREGNHRVKAARGAGVSYELVRQYRKATAGWAKEESVAEWEAVGAVENALYRDALKGSVTAQQVYLYNRAPKRWRDRRNLKVTGGGKGGEVVVKVLGAGASLDEL